MGAELQTGGEEGFKGERFGSLVVLASTIEEGPRLAEVIVLLDVSLELVRW